MLTLLAHLLGFASLFRSKEERFLHRIKASTFNEETLLFSSENFNNFSKLTVSAGFQIWLSCLLPCLTWGGTSVQRANLKLMYILQLQMPIIVILDSTCSCLKALPRETSACHTSTAILTFFLKQYLFREALLKKNVFFRALPKLPLPPPLPLIRATCTTFFGRQKRRFSAYYRTK